MAVVYWIHKEDHTDITTQGYVGVTVKTAQLRFRQHQLDVKRGSQLAVHRAIRKYGTEIKVDTLIEGSEEYCYLMEGKLRPKHSIGYNAAIGGGISPTTGRAHSAETRKKISDALSDPLSKNWTKKQTAESKARRSAKMLGPLHFNFGKKFSEEHRKKLSIAQTGVKKSPASFANRSRASSGENSNMWGKRGYLDPKCNKKVWLDAQNLFDAFHSVGGCGHAKLSTLVHKKFTGDNLETLCNKLKTGWNPSEDSLWIKFVASQDMEAQLAS